ncbi:hypothetical protein [Aeromonas enteropelogenes]|uniref:hypothetical protein n=1 Tax=Aeromonas enteropelogenes TaxID=29489 RepID=UPI0005A9E30A|nr:hypothetical protein [Aeromonas enteropelogenes]UBH52803.1 hypothetical protein LA321_02650 [Aeromonas enteropelogenes]
MSHAIPHAGKKQQTGGWNSGAVALLAIIMVNTLTVFYTVVMLHKKKRSSEYVQLQRSKGKRLI